MQVCVIREYYTLYFSNVTGDREGGKKKDDGGKDESISEDRASTH